MAIFDRHVCLPQGDFILSNMAGKSSNNIAGLDEKSSNYMMANSPLTCARLPECRAKYPHEIVLFILSYCTSGQIQMIALITSKNGCFLPTKIDSKGESFAK